MDHAKARASVDRQYEDFQPATEWVQEKGSQTFIVYLSGFRKEQLKVQVTSTRNMRISGERPLGNHKWSRFKEECAIPSDCDINSISAKFEGGMLYVKLPKKATPEAQQREEEAKLATEAPKEPAKKAEKEGKGQEHETNHHPQPVASATRKEDKQADKKINSNAKQEEEKRTLREKSGYEATRDAKKKIEDGLAEAGKVASTSSGKAELGKLKKSATDLAMRLKKPKALMNLAVCVVLIGVIMLYVTNAMKSLGIQS